MKFAVEERQESGGPAHALPRKIAKSGMGRTPEDRIIRTSDSRLAPTAVHQVLNSPGESLSSETRRLFESRFGVDFSGVRVHADSHAAASAKAAVNAEAYGTGSHEMFDESRYSPATVAGTLGIAKSLKP